MLYDFKNICLQTPDPQRALKNIESFIQSNESYKDKLCEYIEPISILFSHSQFLANHCIKYPQSLFNALSIIDKSFPLSQSIEAELSALFLSLETTKEKMKIARNFRKDKQIIITLRDILNKDNQQEIMFEISNLADGILNASLKCLETVLEKHYGVIKENSVSVIALGKLGSMELNYSSDVDLIFVYKQQGETSGITSLGGSIMNKITAVEYYTKLAEEYSKFLSRQTEDGFVYRVDFRLRPFGQQGALVLSLEEYEEYYESWGQLWERAALLRARTVAGDKELGRQFIKMVKPFIYRKYLDIDSINEIKHLKSQVERIKPGTISRDIKRGYGGIREIEFFIHVFQLMYGGKDSFLMEQSTIKALHKILQRGLIGQEDYHHLSENYLFLRTLEHRLQQINDLQVQTLPSSDEGLNIVAQKMGFKTKTDFLENLQQRRQIVRQIYDSLFKIYGLKEPKVEADDLLSQVFWDAQSPEKQLITEALIKYNIKDTDKVIHSLMQIRDNIYLFQNLKNKKILEDIIKKFVSNAVASSNPENSLAQLVGFCQMLVLSDIYLETIANNQELISTFNFVFGYSKYLSKILISSPLYIKILLDRQIKMFPLLQCKKDLDLLLSSKEINSAIRIFKKYMELIFGILFLNKQMDITRLMKSLSVIADIILQSICNNITSKKGNNPDISELAVIGFGKIGGKELIFGSDIDIVLISLNEPTQDDFKDAEKILKKLTSYTKNGFAYKVDTRLRPDGNKGQLLKSISALKNYYFKNAHTWEIQALIKARPITGDIRIKHKFIEIRCNVLSERGQDIILEDIKKMRDRIKKELSKDSPQNGIYDIKLGSGGIEEIEFIVQYLQLKNAKKYPKILTQGTLISINQLWENGILKSNEALMLKENFLFYRIIETMLRLMNETLLKQKDDTIRSICQFMDIQEEVLIRSLNKKKKEIIDFRDDLK